MLKIRRMWRLLSIGRDGVCTVLIEVDEVTKNQSHMIIYSFPQHPQTPQNKPPSPSPPHQKQPPLPPVISSSPPLSHSPSPLPPSHLHQNAQPKTPYTPRDSPHSPEPDGTEPPAQTDSCAARSRQRAGTSSDNPRERSRLSSGRAGWRGGYGRGGGGRGLGLGGGKCGGGFL